MLASALHVPFPQNRLPLFRPSIMHGHLIRPLHLKKIVVVWRDGRDVLISQYYHSLFKNEKNNSPLVEITRNHFKAKDYGDIRNNLYRFIEYAYTGIQSPKFTWMDFVDAWAGKDNVIHTKYEDLRTNPIKELKRIVKALTGDLCADKTLKSVVEKYSFEKLSGRKPGQENKNSFMRKGISGDWINYFSKREKLLFAKYAGKGLIRLGYEKDDSWVMEHNG